MTIVNRKCKITPKISPRIAANNGKYLKKFQIVIFTFVILLILGDIYCFLRLRKTYNHFLTSTTSMNVLGVEFESRMQWGTHMSKVITLALK